MTIVKFGMPDVFVIDEQDREFAVRHMGNGALAIMEMGELNASLFIQVNMCVLKQKYDDLMPCLVVDIHILAVLMRSYHRRYGKRRYRDQ